MKDAPGKFELDGMVTEQGLYRIRFENGKYILLALDAGDMSIQQAITTNWKRSSVKGSEATEEIQQFLQSLQRQSRRC